MSECQMTQGDMGWINCRTHGRELRATVAELQSRQHDSPAVLPSGSELRAENERLTQARDMLAEEREAWKAEALRLREWRRAVSGAIRCAPWFEKGEWGGDKDGWGYHVEMVGWLIREIARLNEIVSRVRDWRQEHSQRQCLAPECLPMADLFDCLGELDRGSE